VRAPFDGVVLASDVITGELVDTTKVLFVVLDPRRVWLTLHVGLEDVGCVAVGRTVKFRPDGLEEEFTGKLTWVGTGSDAKTRTVPVRAELANEAGRLRASTFGVGRIVLREEPDAMVVPAEAVQSDGGSQIVFVRHRDFLQPNGPKEFFVRAVRTGARQGPNTEIIAGVLPGEVVVTRGSRRLLNELKKSTAAGR
jgi:cobalt-zinc-cadmium efflux system membrane fusion protein